MNEILNTFYVFYPVAAFLDVFYRHSYSTYIFIFWLFAILRALYIAAIKYASCIKYAGLTFFWTYATLLCDRRGVGKDGKKRFRIKMLLLVMVTGSRWSSGITVNRQSGRVVDKVGEEKKIYFFTVLTKERAQWNIPWVLKDKWLWNLVAKDWDGADA